MNVHMSEKIMRPDFQGEFTASILAAAASPDLISFAGGLPNPVSFPVEAMEKATAKVLAENGVQALQYSGTQGLPALRAWIAKRYETMGVYDVTADDIIITNGSQQALALQSFHMFDPKIIPVQMNPDGIDCEKLSETVKANPDAKFIYVIPNFQNPTGLSYTKEVHDKVVEILKGTDILVIEDNPYRELRFAGEATDSFGKELGEQRCMLGTFSKIVAPGMRIGWICVRNKELKAKLLSYKSTADLHTSIFSQLVLAQYLQDNDVDAHIEKTKELYRAKANLMMDCMRKYLPEGVTFTPTEGGMFLWATLPGSITSVDLYRAALAKGVAICPGDPFYEIDRGVHTVRLNYSNSTDEIIEKGMKLLGEACAELLGK